MPGLSHEEVAERGEALYDREIRPRVEGCRTGSYVVLDIESGEYEVDVDDLAATKRLLKRCPNAIVYGLRVGRSAAYRLGTLTWEPGR